MNTTPHKPRILFICGRNQWRSRKAQEIYANDQRMEVRSAGVSPISAHKVSQQDLEWADLVLVMEPKHEKRIVDQFKSMRLPRFECLDIPDASETMDDETLTELIRDGTEGHFAATFDHALTNSSPRQQYYLNPPLTPPKERK
jgi:protein-tyrosine phosphatase